MNTLHKYLVALFAVAALGGTLQASYEYDLVNMIGDPIVVKINQERTDNKDYYQIVFPGKTVKQTYPMGNAYCLRKLAWAPYDKTAPLNGGLDLVDKTNGRIPEEKQREFGDKIAYHYAFIPMDIIMQPNEVFKATRKAAADLLKGVDALACQTIDTAKEIAKMVSGVPSIGGGGGGGIGGGKNKPTESKTTQLINILDQLQTTISSIDMKTATALEKAKVKNAIESILTSDNIKILKDTGKIEPIKISHIKNATMAGETSQKTALGIIEAALEKIAITQTSFDIDSFAINTSMSMNTSGSSYGEGSYSSYGSGSSSPTQKNCDFGLGKIGKASGKLAGYTLCKSREFIIYYKVDDDGIPMVDKYGRVALTATTVEGQ